MSLNANQSKVGASLHHNTAEAIGARGRQAGEGVVVHLWLHKIHSFWQVFVGVRTCSCGVLCRCELRVVVSLVFRTLRLLAHESMIAGRW